MKHFRHSPRSCMCDTDGTMPGQCPGPENCPYSDYDAEAAEEARDRRDRWEADAYDRARDEMIDYRNDMMTDPHF